VPRLAGAVPWPEAFAARYRSEGLWLGQTLGVWFAERAQLFREQTAVVDGPRRITYGELLVRVEHAARALTHLDLRELDRVVVQLPNGLELIDVLLALLRLGAVPVLALPAHRGVELEAFCRRSGAVGLIVPERHGTTDMRPIAAALKRTCPTLRHAVVHGSAGEHSSELTELQTLFSAVTPNAPLSAPAVDAADVALLQLSGGSTGIPKLIPRTHDDYLYSVRASAVLCALSPDTRYLAALPMTHNFTLSSPGVLGVLHAGGTVVTCSHPSPEVVLPLLERERVNLVSAVPSLARAWTDAKERHLGARQLAELVLQVGGAKLDPALAQRIQDAFGCKLQQVFGMAEGLVNYTRLSDPDHVVDQTQGRPLSTFDELRLVDPEDPEGPPLPPGQVGELQTRGPYTIRGYYDDRAHDGRHFTRDGYYRTGDLVRFTEDGNLVVEGRLGDRILRAGEKIAPVEVEEHLCVHPSIRDAAVVGVPDEHLGQRSHAFITRVPGASGLSGADVRRFLRERGLAEFKLPDVVHTLDELPRTKVGKTDKSALRERARSSTPPPQKTP
jgi:2,3-dihydroxybenzoate-AMP ligase